MHRERENVWIALEGRRRAVAVMHVEIDDHRPPDDPFPLEYADRDRHVVDETKPLAVIGEGVVKATPQMHRDPALLVIDRQAPGERRAARRDPRGVSQRRGEGDLEQ